MRLWSWKNMSIYQKLEEKIRASLPKHIKTAMILVIYTSQVDELKHIELGPLSSWAL